MNENVSTHLPQSRRVVPLASASLPPRTNKRRAPFIAGFLAQRIIIEVKIPISQGKRARQERVKSALLLAGESAEAKNEGETADRLEAQSWHSDGRTPTVSHQPLLLFQARSRSLKVN
jgi:hypothetical protein